MMSIEKSPAHRVQRDEWADDVNTFEAWRMGLEEECRRTRGEAYRVASMSLVFQAVLFTSVAQTNRLHCSLAWSPIILCVMAGAASTIAMATKFWELAYLKHSINLSSKTIKRIEDFLAQLETEGAGMDLGPPFLDEIYVKPPPPPTCADLICYLLSPSRLSPLLFLLAFSIVVSLSSKRILCQNL